MALADRANEFVEAKAPWTLKKDEAKAEALREICSISLNLFRQIAIYLGPVLPKLPVQANALLSVSSDPAWSDASSPLEGNEVQKFKHLMQRVDPEQVAKLSELSVSAE